ncbi:MAG: single-stranded DNA-binding protein [Myxococcales bacterium FL481]|nr:MAG: single-stranded DNA-binding protein [Myxococcales bacterium FL481]
MNVVILTGRLGADPEAMGESGQKFSIATTRWNSKDSVEETDWHRCKCWGRTAERVARFYSKGALVTIRGEVQYQEYGGKWYTDIIVRECSLPPKGEGAARSARQAPHADTTFDDDIPF